jgi:PTS system cellobiose-specific IIA component
MMIGGSTMSEKKGINSVAMEVILYAGNGREKIDDALAKMAEGSLPAAQELLADAEKDIIRAHTAQTSVIQRQVSGETMEYSLLFIHAQDTIMTINTELRMAQKMLPIVKMLMEKKGAAV